MRVTCKMKLLVMAMMFVIMGGVMSFGGSLKVDNTKTDYFINITVINWAYGSANNDPDELKTIYPQKESLRASWRGNTLPGELKVSYWLLTKPGERKEQRISLKGDAVFYAENIDIYVQKNAKMDNGSYGGDDDFLITIQKKGAEPEL